MSIKVNLDELIENKLYDEIIAGEWIGGELVRIERIMSQYEVSRTPVIQALKKMNERGLVVSTPTGHYQVPIYTPKDLRDIKNLRITLETKAIRDIQKHNIPIDFKTLYEICENEMINSKNDNQILAKRDDMFFHKALVNQAQNSMLCDLHKRVQDRFMLVNYSFAIHPLKKHEIAYNDHKKLLDLLSENEYDDAVALLESHINWAYQTIKMYMKDNI